MIQTDTLIHITQCIVILYSTQLAFGLSKYDKNDLHNLREEVRQMFQHAYDSYLNYAYPYDELRPLSCDGVDTWGSYSLTLIDALDTLAVMGNYTEFQRVVNIVTANANFDANINVSVFETNIRIIGGLLSAHLMSHRAGVEVVPGWPCNGPLLQLAEDVARRLIAAFDTPTGMPYGTVNLRHGVPPGETTVTCTAGVGTFILEFGTLSRLTGDPLFEEVAMNALNALYHHHSPIGLVGNHIDIATGRWTAQDAGIGAGVDSYYEYLAKGAILLQRPELMHMFNKGKSAIEKYLKRDDWHLWVSMMKGQVTLPVFQSLEAYWPGVLSLIGDVQKGMKSLHNYHQVWKQYGFTPEFYYIPQGEVGINRESYPLRPELIESVMYMYRATGDPYLLDVGRDILHSIQHSARTPCGYATIKDVRDHRKEDRMESFFLAETTKYLYLLFDPDNFIHNRGQTGTVVETPWGECVLDAGGYIFNTEAHPIDPGALNCCSGSRQQTAQYAFQEHDWNPFKGEPLSSIKKHKSSQETSHQLHDPNDASPVEDTDQKGNQLPPTYSKSEKTEPVARREVEGTQQGNIDEYLEKIITDLSGAIKVISVQKQLDKAVPGKVLEHGASTIPLFVPLEKEGVGKHSAPVDQESVQGLESEGKQSGEGETESYDFGTFRENRDKETESFKYIQGEAEVFTTDEEIEEDDQHDELDDQYEGLETEKMNDLDSKGETDEKHFDQAKLDMLEYRADDSDPTYPVNGKVQEGNPVPAAKQLDCLDSWSTPNNDVLPLFVKQYLLATSHTKLRFDPQELFQRIRTSSKYEKNSQWESDYKILSCAAQPFLQRLSLSGEMFEAL